MTDLEIVLRFRCWITPSRSTNLFLANCPALSLVMQGRTSEEAKKTLEDGIQLLSRYGLEHGSFEDALRLRGLRAVPKIEPAPNHYDDWNEPEVEEWFVEVTIETEPTSRCS